MSVFEEFTIDEYIPITDDDVTAKDIAELTNKLGIEHLTVIDGQQQLNPDIKQQPPSLTRQESIGASFVKTLYINPLEIDSDIVEVRAKCEKLATTSIRIINEYLSKLGLFWSITYETIKDKLRKNGKYLGNTLYGIWRLADGAKLVMNRSLSKNPDAADSTTVIIDYSNLKYGLEYDCEPAKFPGVDLADEINNWTMGTFGRTDRIIISIQANDMDKLKFENFKTRLQNIFGPKNIVIIVGSDASSYDDLNIAYIVTKLLPKSNKYIISSDKFRDLHRIYPDLTDKNPDCKGWATSDECKRNPVFMNEHCAASCRTSPISTSPIFVNTPGQLQMITIDTFCQPPNYRYKEPSRMEPSRVEPYHVEPYRVEPSRVEPSHVEPSRVEPSRTIHDRRIARVKSDSSPYARGGPYRRKRGGTNKNKKSLLNKYTRKLKKLHKKRILSKKVVKKYNKNYKNYKNKTLKRKHK